MLFIVDGQPKSGSTFLFRLVERLVQPTLTAEDLQSSASSSPMHVRPGETRAIPFVRDVKALAGELECNEAWKTSLARHHAALKMHHGRWLSEEWGAGTVTHFFTYRNVLDAALALLDQGRRETERPANRQRPAFLALVDPQKALEQALAQFRQIVIPALSDDRIVSLPYPSFISGETASFVPIARATGLPAERVRETAAGLDQAVRQGDIRAEFGTGVPGRGKAQADQFPGELVEEAEALNLAHGL